MGGGEAVNQGRCRYRREIRRAGVPRPRDYENCHGTTQEME